MRPAPRAACPVATTLLARNARRFTLPFTRAISLRSFDAKRFLVYLRLALATTLKCGKDCLGRLRATPARAYSATKVAVRSRQQQAFGRGVSCCRLEDCRPAWRLRSAAPREPHDRRRSVETARYLRKYASAAGPFGVGGALRARSRRGAGQWRAARAAACQRSRRAGGKPQRRGICSALPADLTVHFEPACEPRSSRAMDRGDCQASVR